MVVDIHEGVEAADGFLRGAVLFKSFGLRAVYIDQLLGSCYSLLTGLISQ